MIAARSRQTLKNTVFRIVNSSVIHTKVTRNVGPFRKESTSPICAPCRLNFICNYKIPCYYLYGGWWHLCFVWTKYLPFCRHFQIYFLVRKLSYFVSNFTVVRWPWRDIITTLIPYSLIENKSILVNLSKRFLIDYSIITIIAIIIFITIAFKI